MDPSVRSQADSSADSHGPGVAYLRATTIRTQAGFQEFQQPLKDEWLGRRDSNPDTQIQSLQSYR